MFERPRSGERAVLVHVEFSPSPAQEELGEFYDLVASAGASAVACVTANRQTPDPGLFVGAGKADEIHDAVTGQEADVVIVNHALNPAQERNLERRIGCRVVDRIELILDIFAQRASSFEGKLQVELAQLKHLSTRLVRGWTHLERQKGGIGLRGPGEKQLESDRRLITERIRQINRRLDRVQRRRELSRRSRRKAAVPVVSLVGYTNAGKSTLFNRLTGAHRLTADQLFATLDPTLRRVDLPGIRDIILVDTVGFIRHLPHELIAAFRATLEETRNADLLLHVIDAGAQDRRDKIRQVNGVLREIRADQVPQIEVMNKIDTTERNHARMVRDRAGRIARVWLSARTGMGIELLKDALGEHYQSSVTHQCVRLSPESGRLRARLFELGKVLEEHLDSDGEWVMEVDIDTSSLERLLRDEGLDPANVAASGQAA